jgi:hypothetical protein
MRACTRATYGPAMTFGSHKRRNGRRPQGSTGRFWWSESAKNRPLVRVATRARVSRSASNASPDTGAPGLRPSCAGSRRGPWPGRRVRARALRASRGGGFGRTLGLGLARASTTPTRRATAQGFERLGGGLALARHVGKLARQAGLFRFERSDRIPKRRHGSVDRCVPVVIRVGHTGPFPPAIPRHVLTILNRVSSRGGFSQAERSGISPPIDSAPPA